MITSNPDPVLPLSAIAVETVELDGGVLVFIEGHLDSQTAPELTLALSSYNAHRLLVDLSHVDFFDASAVSVLLSTAHRVRAHGGSLRIVAVSAFGRRVLDLLDLSDTFGLDLRTGDVADGACELTDVPAVTDLRGDADVVPGDNDDRSGGSCPTP